MAHGEVLMYGRIDQFSAANFINEISEVETDALTVPPA